MQAETPREDGGGGGGQQRRQILLLPQIKATLLVFIPFSTTLLPLVPKFPWDFSGTSGKSQSLRGQNRVGTRSPVEQNE